MPVCREACAVAGGNGKSTPRLSYKFQRLREQIRKAILDGEYRDRMPGERDLGRKFGANAKTINKALNDLSAEGLVVRRIGCGTFVAGHNGQGNGTRPHSILCLTPDGPTDPPHRRHMLDVLSEANERTGHMQCRLGVSKLDESGDIPLAAWPAETRHTTDNLLAYPYEPLSGSRGRFGEACLAEAFRRHVPTMVIGADSAYAKINAVVPDYADAGYRLCEYLLQLGVSSVMVLLNTGNSREANTVLNGSLTAGARHKRAVTKLVLRPERMLDAATDLTTIAESACGATVPYADSGHDVGVLCVGSEALRVALADERISRCHSSPRIAMACVLEPGDQTARSIGLTSYDVEPSHLVGWAAKILPQIRPGQRPIEVIVPGSLHVRRTTPVAAGVS